MNSMFKLAAVTVVALVSAIHAASAQSRSYCGSVCGGQSTQSGAVNSPAVRACFDNCMNGKTNADPTSGKAKRAK